MTWRDILAGVVTAISLSASLASGQQVVRGRVLDEAKTPLADVEVMSRDMRTTTAKDGSFLLTGFPMGTSRIGLRRVGYLEVSLTVNFYTADTLYQSITMVKVQRLDTMR